MRIIKAVFVAYLFLNVSLFEAFSQRPCSGFIYLNSQDEIDQFAIDFGHCSMFDGHISIRPDSSNRHGTIQIDSLTALSFLTFVRGISIWRVTGIKDLSGLKNLDSVTDFSLSYLPDLTSLEGLDSMKLMRRWGLVDLPRIQNLLPFRKIDSELWGLFIYRMNRLKSLDGIENMTFMDVFGINMEIAENDSLIDIKALSDYQLRDDAWIGLWGNPQLSDCSIKNFCNHLAKGKPLSISGNGQGCKSHAEILGKCTTSIADGRSEELYFYPNPTSYSIRFSDEVNTIIIYTVDGRAVGEFSVKNKEINVSDLNPGIYFLAHEERILGKLIRSN